MIEIGRNLFVLGISFLVALIVVFAIYESTSVYIMTRRK
jgi:hypothetical protein